MNFNIETFSLFFENSPDGAAWHEIITDANGKAIDYRFLVINSAFEKLTGLKKEKIIGKTVKTILPFLESIWIERYAEVALTGKPTRFDHYSRDLKRNYDVMAYCPKPGTFLVVFRDYTEIKNDLEKCRTILSNFPVAITLLDRNGNVLEVNREAERILDLSRDSHINKIDFSEITFIHPDGSTMPITESPGYLALKKNTVIHNTEMGLKNSTGKTTWLAVTAAPVPIGDGSVVITFFDITEKCRSDRARTEIEKQLFQATKLASIGTLAAGVAHEINNPLAIVRGFLDTTQDYLKQKHYWDNHLEEVWIRQSRALERINKIVQGLRNYARADEDYIESVDIHRCLQDTLALCENIFRKADIQIETDLQANNSWIKGNSGRIQQIMMNLLTNARDALKRLAFDKLIRIETKNYNNDVVIRFIDNGQGIQSEDLPRIFDPFFTTKVPGEGTGLGLAIVQSLISSMAGHIAVESEASIGTIFTVTFPFCELSDSNKGKLTPKVLPTIRSRILIVDDEEDLLNILKEQLLAYGLTVDTANNVDTALELIDINSYNFVITDMLMPEKTGDQLIKKVIEVKKNPPKFIVVTGGIVTDYNSEQRQIIRQHSSGFLRKPFSAEAIVELIISLQKRDRSN